MSTPAPAFERLGIMKFLAFSVLTGSLYICYWLHKLRPELAKVGPLHALSNRLVYPFYAASVIDVVTGVIFYDEKVPLSRSPQLVPFLVAGLLMIVIIFRIKAALHAYFVDQLGLKLPMSSLMTFVFYVFFLQHQINKGLQLRDAAVQAELGPLPNIS